MPSSVQSTLVQIKACIECLWVKGKSIHCYFPTWCVTKEGMSHPDEYLLNRDKQEVDQQNFRWVNQKSLFWPSSVWFLALKKRKLESTKVKALVGLKMETGSGDSKTSVFTRKNLSSVREEKEEGDKKGKTSWFKNKLKSLYFHTVHWGWHGTWGYLGP